MADAIALAEQIAGRELAVERHAAMRRRRPAHERRRREGRARARLGAVAPRSRTVSAHSGTGSLLGSRLLERDPRTGRVGSRTPSSEVDLRSAWERLTARWWLPVGGLSLGAILGVLVSVGSGHVYSAERSSTSASRSRPPVAGRSRAWQTNPQTVSEIVRSEAAIKTAAAARGCGPAAARQRHVDGRVQPGQAPQLYAARPDRGSRPDEGQGRESRQLVREHRLTQVVPYITRKMTLLEEQISNDEQQLEEIASRIAAANQQQRLASDSKTLSLAEKLLVSTNSNATVNAAEQRRGTVLQDLNSARQLLSLAENVELSRVVQPGVGVADVGDEPAERRRRRCPRGADPRALAAIVADPWMRRRSAAAA